MDKVKVRTGRNKYNDAEIIEMLPGGLCKVKLFMRYTDAKGYIQETTSIVKVRECNIIWNAPEAQQSA